MDGAEIPQTPARAGHGLPQDIRRSDGFLGEKCLPGKPDFRRLSGCGHPAGSGRSRIPTVHFIRFPSALLIHDPRRHPLKIPVGLADKGPGPDHVFHGAAIHLFCGGQDHMADAVSGIEKLPVGGVTAIFYALRLQVVLDLLPSEAQKRPDDGSPHRGNPGQSRKPRAPEQVIQYGLRAVVHVVGHRDAGRAAAQALLLENPVARLAARLLQRKPPAGGKLRHILAAQDKGHAQPFAERAGKISVPAGLVPADPVVHVHRQKMDFQLLPAGRQKMEKAHGITPAGQGDDHPSAGIQHVILPYICQKTFSHKSLPESLCTLVVST